MSILFVLVPLSLALVAFAGWAFFWAVNNGQFDDLECSGWDVLAQDPVKSSAAETKLRDHA